MPNRTRDLFGPWMAFPAAYAVWFALGSLTWIEAPAGFSFGLFEPIGGAMWGIYALGLAGYFAGALLVRQDARVRDGGYRSGWNDGRARAVILVLLAAMMGAWGMCVLEKGIPLLSADGAELRLEFRGPAYFLFMNCAWTVFLLAPAHAWSKESSRGTRRVALAAAVAAGLLLISISSRSNLVVPALTLAIVYHFARKRLEASRVAVLGAVGFVCASIFGYLRDFAGAAENGADWVAQTFSMPAVLVPLAYAGLYVKYSVAALRDVVAAVPEKVPFQHGALTLAPFATVLPGRHEMADVFFKDLMGNNFLGAGQPATLLAPFYADFGLPGVFAGMCLYGWIAAVCYRSMQRERSALRVLLYAWVLQSGLFGLFASVFPYITTLWLPVVWAILHTAMASVRRA